MYKNTGTLPSIYNYIPILFKYFERSLVMGVKYGLFSEEYMDIYRISRIPNHII